MFQADEKRMKKAVKPIKSLEQHIYVNVLALLAIFVGIGTISQSTLKLDSKVSLIEAALVQCASYSVLFLLITLLMPNKKNPWVYLILMAIAIACIFFLLKH